MASDFLLEISHQTKGIQIMNIKVNDLRVASQYKKQFSDKFNLKDSDFLIDAQTNWVKFETEFELGGVKYHPYLSYENKNANTPKIIDISLIMDSGYMKDVRYKSAYIESSKPSEVSIHNVIEMCKNMMYEMKIVEELVRTWAESPNERRYDMPYPEESKFWSHECFSGSVGADGWIGPKSFMKEGSKEAKDLYEESKRLIDLLNTLPNIVSVGRSENVEVSSYHMKHLLERMDGFRSDNRYFSNGSAIATIPLYLEDRFNSLGGIRNRIVNISSPNCDILVPKQMYYMIEAIDKNVNGGR